MKDGSDFLLNFILIFNEAWSCKKKKKKKIKR